MRAAVRVAVAVVFVLTLMPAAPPAQAHDAGFSFRCYFSHRLPDDPIVYPNLPGASHSHEFLGNTTVDAFSTPETMRGEPTNCSIPENSSGYWIPTLLDGGAPVAPSFVNVYYRPGRKRASTVKPFPQGLVMIAGDASATSPQPTRVVAWGCGANGLVWLQGKLPTCKEGYDLVLYVHFPDCWNGRSLDSADHRSHMRYASRRKCPRKYPVPVPQLVLSVHYPVRGGDSLELSSGGKYSGHADFMEAWDRALLEDLVRRCINRGEHCHF